VAEPHLPLAWGAEALWEALVPLLPGISVEVVASLPSTNTTLLERARADVRHQVSAPEAGLAMVRRSVESGAFGRRAVDWQPCLLVAEQQTAGRGRLGRDWHAEPAASLSFSLALPLAPADWSGLSLAVGVALAEALSPAGTGGPHIGLKWPNDLWLIDAPDGQPAAAALGRKLGGILIETVSTGERRLAVIGIGLNVQPLATGKSSDWSSGVASLHEIDSNATPPKVLAAVVVPLVQALQRFEREGFAPFAEGYAARDLLRDQAVSTTQATAREGIARGVGPDGQLRVDTPGGRVMVHSGEVSVRPSGAAGASMEPTC
jgi:BirA family transcriptional regulator, biotin operon repressor / biotin---[acetyl-CoA-carboxylase] ligase